MKYGKLLLVVLAMLAMVNVSFGQDAIPSGTARFEALGYNPFLFDASRDMDNNPAWGSYYRNYMFGDVGREVVNQYQLTGQFAGINFGLGKQIALGMILNKRDDMFNDFTNDGYFNATGVQQPIVPIKVLFAYKSDNFSFGIAPYYASWSTERKAVVGTFTSDSILKSSAFGVTLGTVLWFNKTDFFEGVVKVGMNSFKSDVSITGVLNATDVRDNEGGLQLGVGLRGRFLAEKNSRTSLVPYIAFNMYSWNPKIVTTPTAWTTILPKYSRFNIRGGLGINMPVLDDGLFIGGLSVGFNSYNAKVEDQSAYDFTYTQFVFPQFNLGLEWKFTEWLTGRMGYARAVISDKGLEKYNGGAPPVANEFTNWSTSPTDADQTVTMGLGFHFGRFSLDATMGEKLLKSGPYVVTGNDGKELFGVISASYNFNR